MKDRTK